MIKKWFSKIMVVVWFSYIFYLRDMIIETPYQIPFTIAFCLLTFIAIVISINVISERIKQLNR